METLIGLNSEHWMALLRKNFFNIPPSHWGDLLKLTFLSLRNTSFMKKELNTFGEQIEATEIKEPPIFILGHWRSGTTLLHKLMSNDPQFAYPNIFEVYNPWTFLTTESLLEERLKNMPAEKRPMDNMVMRYSDPAEDEFAISLMSLKSPLIGWALPKQEAYFDRYLTLHNISEEERQEWKNIFVHFLKKLTLKYQKQLLLKSPHHTARVKTLLEIFPDAKFIHIRRNPYHVFRSTVSLYLNTVTGLALQKRDSDQDTEAIINRFAIMYEFFFEERKKIKENHLTEIAFEELEKDFEAGLEKIYQSLNLPGWENFRPILSDYLSKQDKYQKNIYPEIPDKWKKLINEKWKNVFQEWGYEIEN